MRIIGGCLKGRKLIKPVGTAIRPTADRTREAIFNIIGHRVIGSNVLDLFAGTGAFGIEAISRGARSAVFVENDKEALSLITRNVKALNLEEIANVVKLDVLNNLNTFRFHRVEYDIIFLDPPYGKGMVTNVLNLIHNFDGIASNAVVIVEHAIAEPIPSEKQSLRLYDQRRYGNSLVSFLTNML